MSDDTRPQLVVAPTVSVIIPTFNRAALLPQAIDSILAQSLSDVEIIVVDDGSTDETPAVVRRYGNRVHYVRTDNGGVAHARNVGTRYARGRYITFVDSDDKLYPYALELLAGLLDRYPAAGLACAEMSGFDAAGFSERYHLKSYHRSAFRDPAERWDHIYEEAHRLGDIMPVPASLRSDDADACNRQVYLGQVFDTYLLRLVLCQNSVMLRREVRDAVGDRDVRVRHWQEVDYLLKITRHHVVCFVDVPTYQLRYHAGQISVGDGRTWLRKQRILLQVVRRHATCDADYYAAHKGQVDEHLAHLHRAVAVPLLLQDVSPRVHRRYAVRARVHLARAARYGYPARGLELATRLPRVASRLLVSVIEMARRGRGHATRRSA